MLQAYKPWSLICRCAAFACLLQAGCQRPSSGTAAAAAAQVHDESSLNKVLISAEQVKSLDIKTDPARKEKVQERRRLNGWILSPQGKEVTVTASIAGYIRAPKAGQIPLVGYLLPQGEELLAIDPVLTPLEHIQLANLKRTIDGDLNKAEENLRVATLEADRIADLHSKQLRSDQDLDQAKSKVAFAKEDKQAALDKQKLFNLTAGAKLAQLPLQAVNAPIAGKVLTVHVSPGQYVQAAAPLVTLADYTQLWVRVPVPEYDLARIMDKEPALIILPGAIAADLQADGQAKPGGKRTLEAKRKAAVPQVDPIRHTGDVIYELPADPALSMLSKDQMVGVFVPLGNETEESVVKYSAVIFDAYGGSWIYLDRGADAKSGLNVYERRRVELGVARGDDVSVRPALQANDRVVVDGAAKLFSAEFFKAPILKAK